MDRTLTGTAPHLHQSAHGDRFHGRPCRQPLMAERDNTGAELAPEEITRRRAKARRTALFLAAISTVVFVSFLVTGITGRG